METPITAPLPTVSELIKRSFAFYKKDYKKFWSLSIPPLSLAILGVIISFILNVSNIPEVAQIILMVIGLLISLATTIVSILFPIVIIKNIKDSEENISSDTKTLYKNSLELFFPVLWVGILLALICLGGSILFLIPGIALMGYLGYYQYTVIFDGKRGLEALIASFYYVRGNWWGIFGRFLLLGLILGGLTILLVLIALVVFMLSKGGFSIENIVALFKITETSGGIFSSLLNVVTAMLQYSVLYPLFTFFSYFIFKELRTKTLPDEQKQKKARRWFVGLSIVGLVIALSVVLISLSNARNKALRSQTLQQNTFEQQVNHVDSIPL